MTRRRLQSACCSWAIMSLAWKRAARGLDGGRIATPLQLPVHTSCLSYSNREAHSSFCRQQSHRPWKHRLARCPSDRSSHVHLKAFGFLSRTWTTANIAHLGVRTFLHTAGQQKEERAAYLETCARAECHDDPAEHGTEAAAAPGRSDSRREAADIIRAGRKQGRSTQASPEYGTSTSALERQRSGSPSGSTLEPFLSSATSTSPPSMLFTASRTSPDIIVSTVTPVFRASSLRVVNKPPLMHVHRPEFGSKDPKFLLQKARDELGQRVYTPHRLDRGTSGCLLLGFSPGAAKVLHTALGCSESCKTYVAIARGSGSAFIGKGWFTVERPLKDKNGPKAASTRFLFVRGGSEPGPRCCLVIAQPLTGRFHQIRRHLRGLGHPVIGDAKHGDCRFNRAMVADFTAPPGRLMLHCLRIQLPASALSEVTIPGSLESVVDEKTSLVTSSETERRESKQSIRSTYADAQGPSRAQEALAQPNYPDTWSAAAPIARPSEELSGHSGGLSVAHNVHTSRADEAASGDACAQHGDLEGRRGLDVSCYPPDDMMIFLRSMAWWEEGIMEEAQRVQQAL